MKLIQWPAFVVAAGIVAALAGASSRAETTSVNNGSNSASISQSGDPAKTDKRLETRPGYTHLEQRNGGNSATIIQQSKPGASDGIESEGGNTPNGTTTPDGTEGDDERGPALTDSDVYRQVRKGASPQSQQTLDNLMKSLGLQKKM
jgi:DNA-binding phage protein